MSLLLPTFTIGIGFKLKQGDWCAHRFPLQLAAHDVPLSTWSETYHATKALIERSAAEIKRLKKLRERKLNEAALLSLILLERKSKKVMALFNDDLDRFRNKTTNEWLSLASKVKRQYGPYGVAVEAVFDFCRAMRFGLRFRCSASLNDRTVCLQFNNYGVANLARNVSPSALESLGVPPHDWWYTWDCASEAMAEMFRLMAERDFPRDEMCRVLAVLKRRVERKLSPYGIRVILMTFGIGLVCPPVAYPVAGVPIVAPSAPPAEAVAVPVLIVPAAEAVAVRPAEMGPTSEDFTTKLERMFNLLKDGAITQEEFEASKAAIVRCI